MISNGAGAALRASAHGVLPSIAALLFSCSLANAQLPPLESRGQGDYSVPSIYSVPHGDARMTWIGSVTSQGDAVMSAPLTRTTFGVDGGGIKVGVISDSFNRLGGLAAGIASGDLPGAGNPNGYVTPINILNEDLSAGTIDEGRGMAELIHDVAPGAQLLFHSAFNNASASPGGTIATAINNLVAAGADIIVDDVGWLFQPAYQDGKAAQAAKAAYNAGIPFFSSAGNNSNNAYEGVYSPIFGTNHNFDGNANEGGDNILNISNIPNNGTVRATLWWDDRYPTLGGGNATSDLHLGLVDLTTNTVVAGSAQNQLTGADAYEFFGFQNTTGATHAYGLFVQDAGGNVANKLLKIQVFGQTIADDDDTNSPTTFGHNSAEGVVGVAAASVFNPNSAEPFTALGPTTILRDTLGNSLAIPQIRDAPQITGPDGGNTTFFGSDSANDADAFPNFFGTSAAAPHVAAVAALVMQRAANLGLALSPSDLYNILFDSTVDIEAIGFDNLTGWGRLDAFLAVSSLVPEPGTLTMSLVGLGLLLGVAGRRRRERRV